MKHPFPGSQAAIEAGCICEARDNRRGKGFDGAGNRETHYWVMEGCSLHDKTKKSNASADR